MSSIECHQCPPQHSWGFPQVNRPAYCHYFDRLVPPPYNLDDLIPLAVNCMPGHSKFINYTAHQAHLCCAYRKLYYSISSWESSKRCFPYWNTLFYATGRSHFYDPMRKSAPLPAQWVRPSGKVDRKYGCLKAYETVTTTVHWTSGYQNWLIRPVPEKRF